MTQTLLATLAASGIIHHSGRGTRVLRVSPRFLAYAEQTAQITGSTNPRTALATALASWDEFTGDCHAASSFLEQFLADRHQLGNLQPVFPTLDAFAAA